MPPKAPAPHDWIESYRLVTLALQQAVQRSAWDEMQALLTRRNELITIAPEIPADQKASLEIIRHHDASILSLLRREVGHLSQLAQDQFKMKGARSTYRPDASTFVVNEA